MEALWQNFQYLEWRQVVMWIIGGLLIYLAIKKEMEPTLLLPMGFGAILVNLPTADPEGGVNHVIDTLFRIGISEQFGELMPLILFIGIYTKKLPQECLAGAFLYIKIGDFVRK